MPQFMHNLQGEITVIFTEAESKEIYTTTQGKALCRSLQRLVEFIKISKDLE